MNSNEKPLVSVIIPTYKRSDMLPHAIQSVMEQTYENVQAVVVDDNNPDTSWRQNTERMMAQYQDNPRVKYVKHSQNKNGSAARNTGIRMSDGEIVCFLDDDDFFYREKVEKQVDFLLNNPQYRAVYCGWDRNGVVISEKCGDLSFELLSGTNLVYTNAIMMWRTDALAAGWDETFKRHQEAAFLLRYFRNGGLIGVVPECLVGFDISDRSNAPANGKINEQYLRHYLSAYPDIIESCDQKRPGAAKDIYSYRFRSVLLCYIARHEFLSACKLYCKMVRKMPLKFNADLLRYTHSYLKRKRG